MNRQYQQVYESKSIDHQKLLHKIQNLYLKEQWSKPFNFDEILFRLDQKCINQRCDRNVARELFDQAANFQEKASIQDIIFKFIQNLETTKMCLIRDQRLISQLHSRCQKLRNRKKTYVYLKMLQASVYSRFSRSPSLEYQIIPSEIPPITLVNALNPILNQEYTLELEQESFDIVFYESGIEIFTWTFPDSQDLSEGEYLKSVNSQNVSFEAQIKYLPKGFNAEKDTLDKEIQQKKKILAIEAQAFTKLCNFQPFLDIKRVPPSESNQKSSWWEFTENTFLCLPFLKRHVRNTCYYLIILLIIQCWASYFFAMQFLDIMLIFYSLGAFFDKSFLNFSLELLIMMLSFALMIAKSIWGLVSPPASNPNPQQSKGVLLLCLFLKILVILLLWINHIRKDQIPIQRNYEIYQQKQIEEEEIYSSKSDQIWEKSIK